MGSSDKLPVSRRQAPREGSRRSRGTDGECESPTFSPYPISRKPSPSDGPSIWRKYYQIVEGQLRLWYRHKNTLEAPEQVMMEKWSLIYSYIENLVMASVKIFHIDTNYFLKNELDVRLWKYGIYQFILLLRSVPQDSKFKTHVNQAYKIVYDKGRKYFKELLVNVPEVLKIDLKPIFNRSSFLCQKTDDANDNINLVYRLFIALGDLYRYNFEMFKFARDGKLAKDMYIAARYCDPEKSRAYNQLGVILKAQNDIVGTIYHYTRACSAASPAEGSREQLLFVYDEIYKKFNLVRKDYWFAMSKTAEEGLNWSRQNKYEIWIPPKSLLTLAVPPTPQVPPSKKDYFSSLSQNDVLSQFSLAFAHFIGMLFTKIGTEALGEVALEVTVCFEGLLMKPGAVKFSFAMEVLGMLLFITDYLTAPSDSSSMEQGTLIQLQYMREEAVKVTLNILMIFAERMHQIIALLDWDNNMLTVCSAVYHVWCRWARRRPFICSELLQQRKLFKRSPRRTEIERKETVYNFLLVIGKLNSCLSELLTRHAYILFPEISTGFKNEQCIHALGSLPEQLVLEKFGNVICPQDFDISSYYHDGGNKQGKAQIHFRLARIQRFLSKIIGGELTDTGVPFRSLIHDLVGKELHLLRFIHESINKPLRSRDEKAVKVRRPDCNNARTIIREDKADQLLKASQSLPITKTYEIWSDLCVRGVRTEIVIEPVDVVLDTNCLIRRLEWITCLSRLLPRPLIIPTTVLLELRGLKKGARTGESAKPVEKDLSAELQQERMIGIMEIGAQCIRALEYLQENRQLFRLVTISGHDFKMYNYLKQRVYDRAADSTTRNDEKILETCIQLEARNKKLRSQDTPLRIFRNTILLTGDRSLRVRAFAHDIPARDIQTFTKWLLASREVRESRNRKKR